MKFKIKDKYNVAIMGATGAVGQEMVRILEERKFPVKTISFLASERSLGKQISFRSTSYPVKVLNEKSFEGVDVVLASAGGSISAKYAAHAVESGAVVIDNTSAFRMDPEVPLVIPEINASDIRKQKGIIANPNCSTIVMLVPLYPLHRIAGLKRIFVATYQAASGAGAKAMEELRTQSNDLLQGRTAQKKAFKHQIAFNVFSHDSNILQNGFNAEENKMIVETHKILNNKKIKVSATCVRVPVFRAHSEAIFAEFEKEISPKQVTNILRKSSGIKIVDDRESNYFPMPIDAADKDDILVGRIRQDLYSKKSLSLFVSGDQIRKGAALNAVQIAEKLCGRSKP